MFRRMHDPPNRFDPTTIDWEVPPDDPRLQVVEDRTCSILSRNDSPDLAFVWSANPYRGCTHACSYCYARRFHEYLDYNAGTDFETRILVKPDAPLRLREAFDRPSWKGELVVFSGVTDCYQPLERRWRITRGCLEVCARYRNPVGIITRSSLVARDVDVLTELAAHDAVDVHISIPILDPVLCRKLEPGAPDPRARLRGMRALADAGVPVGVSLAPIIPGVNDRMIPDTLAAARDAGARWAWMSLVRLSGAVADVFSSRLEEAMPLAARAVLARIRRARGGSLSDARFDERMRGSDEAWAVTRRLFEVHRDRLGFEGPPPHRPTPFRRPAGGQLELF